MLLSTGVGGGATSVTFWLAAVKLFPAESVTVSDAVTVPAVKVAEGRTSV